MNHKITVSQDRQHAVKVTLLTKTAARNAFSGDFLSSLFIEKNDEMELLLGLGDEPLNIRQWQNLFAHVEKITAKHKIAAYDVDITPILEQFGPIGARYATLGLSLSTYSFSLKSKTKTADSLEINLLIGDADLADIEVVVRDTESIAEGVFFARDLINLPSNHLHPLDMARKVTELLSPLGVECETLEVDQLREKGLNGLLLIGDSSVNKPCLLVLRYLPLGPDADKIGLVGKGVTYDSGGYSMKPPKSMMTMKCDMAGGATVASTIYALAKNEVQTNVIAVIPLCENRVSEQALVPGDVYTAYSGQTVEVLNTDAEGRLVLADAVTYIQKDESVSRIVDIATLTGAVGAALGSIYSGVIHNDSQWWHAVEEASHISGERFHAFPTDPEYDKMLDSNIADMRNIGDGAGTIVGGLFIARFIDKTPWVHLDVAATAYTESPSYAYLSKGGTGFGLCTLYQLCADLAEA